MAAVDAHLRTLARLDKRQFKKLVETTMFVEKPIVDLRHKVEDWLPIRFNVNLDRWEDEDLAYVNWITSRNSWIFLVDYFDDLAADSDRVRERALQKIIESATRLAGDHTYLPRFWHDMEHFPCFVTLCYVTNVSFEPAQRELFLDSMPPNIRKIFREPTHGFEFDYEIVQPSSFFRYKPSVVAVAIDAIQTAQRSAGRMVRTNVPRRFIDQLTEKKDWAGLVRCWLAHELHPVPLEAAIKVLNAASGQPPRRGLSGRLISILHCRRRAQERALADFFSQLQNTPTPHWPVSQGAAIRGRTEAEVKTLLLVRLYPGVQHGLIGEFLHVALRHDAVHLGLDATEQALKLALDLGDDQLADTLYQALAGAHRELGDFQAARDNMHAAVHICRRLNLQYPEVYGSQLGHALNNLAIVSDEAGDLEGACVYAGEASRIFAGLIEEQGSEYRLVQGRLLRSLGNRQYRRKHYEDALRAFENALSEFRTLAVADRPEYVEEVASSLFDVGVTQIRLSSYDAAEARLLEALQVWRARDGADNTVKIGLGKALNALGMVQEKLNRLEDAQATLQEALRIRRELVSQDPDLHNDDLAMTLNNLGIVEARLRGTAEVPDASVEYWQISRLLKSNVQSLKGQGDVPSWVASARRAFAFGSQSDLDVAISQCSDSEICAFLSRLILPFGISDYDPGPLLVRLQAQNRLPERLMLSCLVMVPRVYMLNTRDFDGILAVSGIEDKPLLALAAGCERFEFHECAAKIFYSLGKHYLLTGDWQRARTLLTSAQNEIVKLSPNESVLHRSQEAAILNSLGLVLKNQREFREAVAVLVRAIELRRGLTSGPADVEHEFLGNALLNLGNAYVALNETKAAQGALEESLAIFRDRRKAWPEWPRFPEGVCLSSLGALFLQSGRPQEAIEVFAEGVSILRELHHEQQLLLSKSSHLPATAADWQPVLLIAMSQMASSLQTLNRCSEAESVYRDVFSLYEAMPVNSRRAVAPDYGFTLSDYADLLKTLGKDDDALIACRQAISHAENSVKSPGELHYYKGRVHSSYIRVLNECISRGERGDLFRCLTALREGAGTISHTEAAGYDAAVEVLAERQKKLGRELRVLVVHTLGRNSVLLAIMGSARKALEVHVSTSFVEKGGRLFCEIEESMRPRGSDVRTRRQHLRDVGREAWEALPEEVRRVLASSFEGDLLVSADSYWAAFPWEALYDEDWVGRHHALPRWSGISALELNKLQRQACGGGYKVAAVVCPWDAVQGRELPLAREEATTVADRLRAAGYSLVKGQAILGQSASKPGMFEIISNRPAVIHYTGHGAHYFDEEVLLLAGLGGCDPFGPADLRQHKQRERIVGGLLGYEPLVVLNSCFSGENRWFGGRREDFVSTLMAEGAAAVIACANPVFDAMGYQFGAWLYEPNESSAPMVVENFKRSRSRLDKQFESDESPMWPLWTLFHFHGNPYVMLP